MRLWVALVTVMVSCGVAKAQTDVAVSVYGAFQGTVNGNEVTQSPSNQAGALIELHHQSNPLVGYELTYAWNRANQRYTEPAPECGLCGPGPGTITQYVPANAHEITADWQVSAHVLNLRPFLLAGGGIIFNRPAGGAGTKTQTSGVLVYGGGLDVALLPHLGLRGQYRGNVYSAPQLSTAFSSTKAFFHTSEPMVGAYFRF